VVHRALTAGLRDLAIVWGWPADRVIVITDD